jgi:hypothetical protein
VAVAVAAAAVVAAAAAVCSAAVVAHASGAQRGRGVRTLRALLSQMKTAAVAHAPLVAATRAKGVR